MTRILDLAEFQLGFFVETGTGLGHRVVEAMRLGFPLIHSIELDHDVFLSAHDTVRKDTSTIPSPSKVMLYHGDSVSALPFICASIKLDMAYYKGSMVTFWLDARPNQYSVERAPSDVTPYPLFDELLVLRNAFRGSLWTPIILINGFSESLAGIRVNDAQITLDTVKAAIYAIDPDYCFEVVRFRSEIPELIDTSEDVLAAFPAWFAETRLHW